MVVTHPRQGRGAAFAAHRVVKRLDAIQNFGRWTCRHRQDRHLTQDHIVLPATPTSTDGRPPSPRGAEHAWPNSHYQTGLKEPLDVAVLAGATNPAGRDPAHFRKVDEIPRLQRRRMSVVVAWQDGGDDPQHLPDLQGGRHRGDPPPAARARRGDATEPLTPELLAHIRAQTDTPTPTVCVVGAWQPSPRCRARPLQRGDEAGFTSPVAVAFLDLPTAARPCAFYQPARQRHRHHRVLTGDNALVTARVCWEVGLMSPAHAGRPGGRNERRRAGPGGVEATTVSLSLSPLDKERVARGQRPP